MLVTLFHRQYKALKYHYHLLRLDKTKKSKCLSKLFGPNFEFYLFDTLSITAYSIVISMFIPFSLFILGEENDMIKIENVGVISDENSSSA